MNEKQIQQNCNICSISYSMKVFFNFIRKLTDEKMSLTLSRSVISIIIFIFIFIFSVFCFKIVSIWRLCKLYLPSPTTLKIFILIQTLNKMNLWFCGCVQCSAQIRLAFSLVFVYLKMWKLFFLIFNNIWYNFFLYLLNKVTPNISLPK